MDKFHRRDTEYAEVAQRKMFLRRTLTRRETRNLFCRMLIALYLLGSITTFMLAVVAAILVGAFDFSLAFGEVVKQRLFSFALFAIDGEIPLAGFTVR